MSNPHEELARYKKASSLARVLRHLNCSAEDAMKLHPDDWLRISKIANVRPPSALTIEEVARQLEEEASNPFDDLEPTVSRSA